VRDELLHLARLAALRGEVEALELALVDAHDVLIVLEERGGGVGASWCCLLVLRGTGQTRRAPIQFFFGIEER
jgi:hypothetical protein